MTVSVGHRPARVASSGDGMAFPLWRDALSSGYGLFSDTRDNHSFQASINVQQVGELKVADVNMRSLSIQSKGRAELQDALLLKLITHGSATFEQNGEQQQFNAGSLILVDPERPFSELISEGARMLVITCAKKSLRDRGYCHSLRRWVAPDSSAADVRMLQGFVSMVAQHGVQLQGAAKERIGEQFLDMLDIITDSSAYSSRGASADAARFRVKQYIARHLGDETLDAAQIAAGVNLSVGYINRLFRAEDTSLIRYLWNCRLERACEMLLDARHASVPIEQIGWLCGFSNAAHFSRVFRKRYGQSPRAVRELHAGQ